MRFTEHLAAEVMTQEAWEALHKPCLAADEHFERAPFQHPDGNWFWLECLCGAKHLCSREITDPQTPH